MTEIKAPSGKYPISDDAACLTRLFNSGVGTLFSYGGPDATMRPGPRTEPALKELVEHGYLTYRQTPEGRHEYKATDKCAMLRVSAAFSEKYSAGMILMERIPT